MAKKTSAQATASTAVSTAVDGETIIQEDLVFLEDQEETIDLSYWEFINPSDADSDTESLHSLENGFVSWYSVDGNVSPPKSSERGPETHIENTHQDEEIAVDHLILNSHDGDADDEYGYFHHNHVKPVAFSIMRNDDDGDDDDDDDDGYGLDDELVPWNLRGKLGRQRMRKLGKRSFAKMGSTRHSAYLFVKPGCVRGKHGLGIKA